MSNHNKRNTTILLLTLAFHIVLCQINQKTLKPKVVKSKNGLNMENL